MAHPIRFGNGRFTAALAPREIFLNALRTDGDIAANGFITVDLEQMRIKRAEAAVQVAEAVEPNLESLANFLPLVREGPGRWFLRRAPGS